MTSTQAALSGVLNINKPSGITSHDVVKTARRILNIRRVGHAGTLDPLATGVLLLLVGPATRLAQYLTSADKVYRAVVRLGATTTTYDAEGDITSQHPVHVDRLALEAALAHFQGPILQQPPMYSAVRVKGQRLYKLARQGKEIDRPARPVTIYRLDVLAWDSPDLTLDIACSSGTYIRSLAYDLGQALGCGAYLHALTRTATGPFLLENSQTLDDLRQLSMTGHLAEALHPPKAALYALPSVHLTPEQVQDVCHGRFIKINTRLEAEKIQARDEDDHLVAVLIPVGEDEWRPKLVLRSPTTSQ